jgi:outer membrane protein, multidrug efflux system
MMVKTGMSLALALVFLGGCSMAPTYERPAAPVPAAWQGAAADGKTAVDTRWHDFFTDDRLRRVVQLALDNNRDLRVTVANIEKARAQYRIERASQFPAVNATAGETASRTPRELSSSGREYVGHSYSASVGFTSYELDLFGRIQSLKEQALAQYLATEEAQRSTQISLVADVVTGWLTLAADRERLKVAQDTFSTQQESLKLIQLRYDVGTATGVDLAQAKTSVQSARYDVARYTSQVSLDINALNLLLGTGLPGDLQPQELPEQISVQEELTPGLPSDTLLRRPDVRQAEQTLIAANANIGAARAAFFPRISLTASTGFGSTQLSDLFQGESRMWSFAPQISIPIFNAGSNRANLDAAKAERDAALAQYEKAVQTAFREVADALAQRSTIDEQVAAQRELNTAADDALRLSRARYDKGVDAYSTVLDSQRSQYTAQQTLITARLARQSNFVALYKVLGGGDKE